MPAKLHLAVVSPSGQKRAVSRGRRANADYRKREHLTDAEVVQLMEAAKANRHGHRDATMILVAYRHGLRASEVCDLRWDDIDFAASAIHVARKKNGVSTSQQLNGQELRALRRLQRAQEPKSAYVFVTERGGPFDRTSFNFMVKRTGRKAGLPFQTHAHMLRHAAGYALANAGRDTPRPQGHQAHRPLHRIEPDPLQELLSRLTRVRLSVFRSPVTHLGFTRTPLGCIIRMGL